MLTHLAARTVSGNTPPLGFRITLWLLVVFFLGGAIVCVATWWRLRSLAKEQPGSEANGGRTVRGGFVLACAVPGVIFGLFLLDWAIQVS